MVFTGLNLLLSIVTLTFDPVTSGFNRVHPLVMRSMSAKFDEDVHNSLVAIAFTRIRLDGLMEVTTATLLYPLHNALRGNK